MSSLLALLLATAATSAVPRLPDGELQADELAPPGLRHQEALRIDRDFGKPEFDLVVDTWTRTAAPRKLADVRLWWVKTTAADRRSPLSTKAKKYVDIETSLRAPGHWTLEVRGDRKVFAFDVELDALGNAHVFTDVIDDDGHRVDHCRATAGRLKARRLLGIPIGIAALAVECVDGEGKRLRGRAVVRRVGR